MYSMHFCKLQFFSPEFFFFHFLLLFSFFFSTFCQKLTIEIQEKCPRGLGVTPFYELCRYVRRKRVWFFAILVTYRVFIMLIFVSNSV